MTQNYKSIMKEIVFPYEIRFRGYPPLYSTPQGEMTCCYTFLIVTGVQRA